MPDTVYVITGPTASGKTQVAVDLAAERPMEVISADSRQVYRGLDIGTAKPTAAEQAALPHHLLDVVDPGGTYSAGQFMADCLSLVHDIRARGRAPVVVGGTGMYLRGLIQGYRFSGQAGDPVVRAKLQKRYDVQGGETLHAELAASDPDYAEKIHPNDKLRVVRGLEILALTGAGPSFQENRREAVFVRGVAILTPLDVLEERIGVRAAHLLEEGWVSEVQALLDSGMSGDAPALQSIGYPEVVALVKGELTETACLRKIITRTRQYARKQLQLMRTFERLEQVTTPEEALERMLALVPE